MDKNHDQLGLTRRDFHGKGAAGTVAVGGMLAGLGMGFSEAVPASSKDCGTRLGDIDSLFQ